MPLRLRGSLIKDLPPVDHGTTPFYATCTIWVRTQVLHTASILRRRPRLPPLLTTTRRFTSPSVINVGKSVPARFKELHEALDRVGSTAAGHINVSRLQLAQRGLESEEPLLRVAVLGLNGVAVARKLVRLLLADPLSPRGVWEDILDDCEADPSQGLLIRYGETTDDLPNNLLPTISIPSPVLKKVNLEILVAGLSVQGDPSDSLTVADVLLVPTVTIPTSHSGRQNFIRYPVHKAIICGKGVEGIFAYSSLASRSDLKDEAESVYGAIEFPAETHVPKDSRVVFVDIKQAEIALEKFRESVENVSAYERGWNKSGVQPVLSWLSSLRASDGLEPSLKTLILSLLNSAEEGIIAKEKAKVEEQRAQSLSDEAREQLDLSVSLWAEKAHSELRRCLDEGFAGKRWKGLAWWKLFWRVDDVNMVASEILDKMYLRQAEREVIWTMGRFEQAGLLESKDMMEDGTLRPDMAQQTQISVNRTKLLNTTAPSLQELAQRLVLFSISTTSLASALSALTYISFPSASVSEVCAAGSVGLIYSLRRQQIKWEAARTTFEGDVRENGRTTLRETEGLLRTAIRERRQIEDVSEREAKEFIQRARNALEHLK